MRLLLGLLPGLLPGLLGLLPVLLPGLLAYPLAGLLRVVWDLLVPLTLGRWETLAALALFGTLYVLAFLLFIWNWVLTRPERMRLSELFVKSFGRLPQWKNS